VPDDDSPLAGAEVHYLRSRQVGDEFKIFVGHCGREPTQPSSTLYVLDGNGFFAGAVDLVRSLQLYRHLPPLLVVGIGYRAGGVADTIDVRTRDLTPTADRRYEEWHGRPVQMGGGPAFLRFILDELKPWAADRFGVEAADSVLWGHSLGGLFATYAMLQAPQAFWGYALSSPSYWWHGRAIEALEDDFAGAHRALPVRAHVSIGADETFEGRMREQANMSAEDQARAAAWHLDMVSDMERFAARLAGRGYEGLELQTEVFPNEFHITVPFLTMGRALRWLYRAPV
jgi:predicted alpha/beta superfamily hydrolase